MNAPCTTNTSQGKHCTALSPFASHDIFSLGGQFAPSHPIDCIITIFIHIWPQPLSYPRTLMLVQDLDILQKYSRFCIKQIPSFLPPFCKNWAYVANLSVLICISLFLLINILGECISSDKLQVQISPDIYLVYLLS